MTAREKYILDAKVTGYRGRIERARMQLAEALKNTTSNEGIRQALFRERELLDAPAGETALAEAEWRMARAKIDTRIALVDDQNARYQRRQQTLELSIAELTEKIHAAQMLLVSVPVDRTKVWDWWDRVPSEMALVIPCSSKLEAVTLVDHARKRAVKFSARFAREHVSEPVRLSEDGWIVTLVGCCTETHRMLTMHDTLDAPVYLQLLAWEGASEENKTLEAGINQTAREKAGQA